VSTTLNLSGSGSLTTSGNANATRTVALTGTGGLVAVGKIGTSTTAARTGAGTLTLSGKQGFSTTVNLTGSGVLSLKSGLTMSVYDGSQWTARPITVLDGVGGEKPVESITRWDGTNWV
jgi:hypothetical protein